MVVGAGPSGCWNGFAVGWVLGAGRLVPAGCSPVPGSGGSNGACTLPYVPVLRSIPALLSEVISTAPVG
jgi:hypothetical protein